MIDIPSTTLRSFIIFALCSATAFAQQLAAFPFSSPKPGTQHTYKNLTTGITTSRTYQESATDYKIRYQINNSKIREQYLFCKYCGSAKNEIDVLSYGDLFPLEIGKTTEFRRWKKSKPETTWSHNITVQEVRHVESQIDSSPFDVFVVYEEIINNQKDWKGSVTYWFSPTLKSNISIIDNAADNLDQVSITQLVDIARP